MSLDQELDLVAFRAWPARLVEEADGWKLRYTEGVTRRANSAWTSRAIGPRGLDERIAHAEQFYSERGIARCFQVTRLSRPKGLDEALAARGYAVDAPVSIQRASATEIFERNVEHSDGLRSTMSGNVSTPWWHVVVGRGRFREHEGAYRGILERLGGRALYATVFDREEPIAAGLGVRESRWMGIFNMHTLVEHRRRGAGQRLIREIAREARSTGCSDLYLQVERDNVGALSLYARAGFIEEYGYHYRTSPDLSSLGARK